MESTEGLWMRGNNFVLFTNQSVQYNTNRYAIVHEQPVPNNVESTDGL